MPAPYLLLLSLVLGTLLIVVPLATLQSYWPVECAHPLVRIEWRRLSSEQRQQYIKTVQCLWSHPAKGSAYFPVRTRHDDFVAMHVNATGPESQGVFFMHGIHLNGVFLPWHRYALHLYEKALREECYYKGPLPFWDWSLDNPENNGAQFNASPVFDPITGFGGNGANAPFPADPSVLSASRNGCVIDGPFADFNLVIDDKYGSQPNDTVTAKAAGRCLKRNITSTLPDAAFGWHMSVKPLLDKGSFANFTYWIDHDVANTGAVSGQHGAGHTGLGGEMANLWSSANDPLFYLHHANLDRIWTIWQDQSSDHLYDMGGPIFPNGTGSTTLDSVMEMGQFMAPSLPIRTVMDTQNRNGHGILCYKYENSNQP